MYLRIVQTLSCLAVLTCSGSVRAELRVGAAAIDITPEKLPVLINGNMLTHSATQINSRLHARAIALDDRTTKLAIVVVDSCMMPRELLDKSKELASKSTGIPVDRMLISATHAHSVPSVFGCLGTDPDPVYVEFLTVRLATAIEAAARNLEPAKVGWAIADASEYTAIRRWVRRPDRVIKDPFGNPTARANMHPGYQSEDAIGESGPIDPDLSVISFQAVDGRPIALLANFSMHYFGDKAVGADYFGIFADEIRNRVAGREKAAGKPEFVGIMSHGTSGDIWMADYSKPKPEKRPTIIEYSNALADIAFHAYKTIEHRPDQTIAMAEAQLPLRYRTPDAQRLEWATRIVDGMAGRAPKDVTEVYAREAVLLHQKQATVIKLQALRIGDVGITAIPNEVYALTGLKLKAQSPLAATVNIELANGAEGYIPPPEQHYLGGYNTWPARSAGLEVSAEPRIVETVLALLEQVAGKPRREYRPTTGPLAQATLSAKPVAYWRLDELSPPRAADATGRCDGMFEPGVVFFLEGPARERYRLNGEVNRAAHFAGGRLRAVPPVLGPDYSVSFWFWNGMPNAARPVAGYLFSRGRDQAFNGAGEHLAIGGKDQDTGKLVFTDANQSRVVGKTILERWKWYHAVLVHERGAVRVYLNGKLDAAGDTKLVTPIAESARATGQLFFGGRNDNESNFEGRLDEIALFDRPITDAEAVLLAGVAP